MSSTRRAARAVAARMSYANVMATLAVFLVLGGGAYAAASLPRNSVGTKQLKRDAVTRSKLADRSVGTSQLGRLSVTTNRLSRGVQRSLRRIGARGPSGPQGLTGARGATGPAGPGARRVDYSAAAAATATPATALDLNGVRFTTSCVQDGANVAMPISVSTAEAADVYLSFTTDGGSDPNNPEPAESGNNQASLAAGATQDLGGPSTDVSASPPRNFNRALATAIVVGTTQTVTLTVAAIADATAGRCTFRGSAVPSS